MKKSNKLTVLYILSSIALFLVLIGGGAYGVYLSMGLTFVRARVDDVAPIGTAQNVAYGESAGAWGSGSSTGVIVLSIVLIIIAVFDFVSLVKQIVFFKQFKPVKDSVFEKSIEKKIKSKKSVVFFACVIDVLSIVAGAVGLFLNARGYAVGVSWIFYLIDGAVCVFALASMILLLVKLKRVKSFEKSNSQPVQTEKQEKVVFENFDMDVVDRIEYFLLKLKHLKSSRMISSDEYESLRKVFFFTETQNDESVKLKQKNKED